MSARRVWTAEQVRALGVRCDGVTACEIVYGVRRTKAYELLGRGEVDFPVIRRGRTFVVPVAALLRLLDIPEMSEPGPVRPGNAIVTPVGATTSDNVQHQRRAS